MLTDRAADESCLRKELRSNRVDRTMTVAFVFSGGAALGSIQVGMARALYEQGIRPDLVTGTSVGALNGAWFAGGGNPDGLAEVWRGLGRSDIFPLSPLHGIRAVLGRRPNMSSARGLRRLLERTVAFRRIEQAELPFIVMAADALTGAEVKLDRGPAVESMLASAALPGVFPPVELNGQLLIDGGIANNTPITTAINAGATEVWVLSTGYSCGLAEPPSNPLALALHGIGLLVQQRLILETRSRDYPVPVHLIPPPCPISVTPIDFSQTEELMDRAYRGTKQWLKNDCPFALPLTAPHAH